MSNLGDRLKSGLVSFEFYSFFLCLENKGETVRKERKIQRKRIVRTLCLSRMTGEARLFLKG